MNIRRILFWIGFVVVIVLIIWGLIAAMNKAPTGPVTTGTPAPVTSADHVSGLESAPVTLIEYSDFQCPACGAYFPLVERLALEASSTLRLVYRHYPLYPRPHANAFIAAQASEAASKQGKFWDMYRLLFDNQTAWAELSTSAATSLFESYATRLGLDLVSFKNDFNSEATKARIQADHDEGTDIGVAGTPTFFVNGKAIVNPSSYEQFKALIQSAVASAK